MFTQQNHRKSKFYQPRVHWVGLVLWGVLAALFAFAFRHVPSMLVDYFRGEVLADRNDPYLTFIFLLLMVTIWLTSCISLLFWLRELVVRWLDCVTLNWENQVIHYQGQHIGRFSQINTIYLRTIYAPKNRRYLSSILMKDGRRLWLEESKDLQAITKPLHRLAKSADKSIEHME